MKVKFWQRRELHVSVLVVLVFALAAFADRNARHHVCRDIVVKLDNFRENHFLDEADVLRMAEAGPSRLRSVRFAEMDFRAMERRLLQHRNLKEVQVYNDLKGNLIIRAALRRPMARLVQERGADAYLSEEGVVMPVSERYSSRVLVLSGPRVPEILRRQSIVGTDWGKQLIGLLTFLRDDPFWSAQIAEVYLREDGTVTLFPQVGSQTIAFGKPENLEEKFFRLRVFYKEVLPRRGWNTYSRISVEYAGQVIAR